MNLPGLCPGCLMRDWAHKGSSLTPLNTATPIWISPDELTQDIVQLTLHKIGSSQMAISLQVRLDFAGTKSPSQSRSSVVPMSCP